MNRKEFDSLFYSIKKIDPKDPKPDVIQSPDELWILYDIVRTFKPKVILEIGTNGGGTAKFWEKAMDSEGLLVSVDIEAAPVEHKLAVGTFNDFSDAISEIKFLRNLDSQAKETVQIVKEAIDFKSVDFLYIDADHSYEGIKADYENYTPLVKPGGIVGFHDTNHPPIKRLLLEKGHTRLKFYDYGFGTGIINGW